MKVKLNNYPNITLENLLKRRKSNLPKFLSETGITTYEFLIERCNRLGVAPPSLQTFQSIVPPQQLSSPTEGVVILPPPTLINDSGNPVDIQPIPQQEINPDLLDDNQSIPSDLSDESEPDSDSSDQKNQYRSKKRR